MSKQRLQGLLAACLVLVVAAASAADSDGDFLAGYAAAVVERDLGLEVESVEVSAGTARIVVKDLGAVSPQRVAEAVVRVEGIERVELHTLDGSAPLAQTHDDESDDGGFEFLPRRELFDPLLADPRQPHFSASMLWYGDDPELTRVGSANFGETFALLGGELGDEGSRWEIGILGGVFSVFDLDADSLDLVNSDFWVAPTVSLRSGRFSTQLRIYHQSSHLGDEFLLRNRTRRVNLSYEGVDLLFSGDLHPNFRVYLGGGVIVHDEPDLDPLSGQVGFELESPIAFFGDVVRPLVAADFQFREQNDWEDEIGAALGIQIENPDVSPLRLQILAQYFRGNSPNGQFYERRIEYLGVGVHIHL